MDAVGALRLSPLRRGLAIDSTVDIFTFYVPHRHVYGEQWIKFIDRKSGSAGMPRPISYAVFCLKKKSRGHCPTRLPARRAPGQAQGARASPRSVALGLCPTAC